MPKVLNRRGFLQRTSFAVLGVPWILRAGTPSVVKPPRLRPGATIGLLSPAGAVFERIDLEIARERMHALGFRTKIGRHALARRGYLAGTDEERAADLHDLVSDSEVDALVAVRGGWGAGRILPLLDYELLRRHPKILIGYSDITSLLLALYARSGLVTFHGPVGISTWNRFTVDHFRGVLVDGKPMHLTNPSYPGDLAPTEHRMWTITPGRARGRLVGGNLSVLSALLGSPYVPDWKGHILFLEDTGEDLYRIDRMLTHLKLAGVLDSIEGLIFGRCTDCEPGEGYGSLTLEEILKDHVAPLGIPAWYGSMIGHIADKFTVPVGTLVEIDATVGGIRMLEPDMQ